MQHETKPSAVFDMRPHPKYCVLHTSRVNGALTDYCFGSAVVVAMDPEHDSLSK